MKKKGRSSDLSVLGEELLVEVLCRLDCAKYAIQCKLVSKLWCSLINTNTNSYFMKHWRSCHQEDDPPVILLTQDEYPIERDKYPYALNTKHPRVSDYCASFDSGMDEFPTLNLDFLPRSKICSYPIRILSTYKDLVLCCPNRYDHSCYYICNPFTKQWTALPPPPPPHRSPAEASSLMNMVRGARDTREEQCLLMERCINVNIRVGFLVHEGNDDLSFTVVRILPYEYMGIPDRKVQIFSRGRWREIDGKDHKLNDMFDYRPERASFDGMLVWLVNESDQRQSKEFVMKFFGFELHQNDDANVNCTRVPLPIGHRRTPTDVIGVCRGHLRLVQLKPEGLKLIVWQFDGSRARWDKVQELSLSEWEDSAPKTVSFRISVLALHPHDENKLYLFYKRKFFYPGSNAPIIPSFLFLCDLQERRLKLIGEIPSLDILDIVFPLMLPCWPTAVPLLQPKDI